MNITRQELTDLGKLKQKKYRDEMGLFLVEGQHAVDELLHSSFLLKYLFLGEDYRNKNAEKTLSYQREYRDKCVFIGDRQLRSLSDTVNPQGIIAVAKRWLPEPEDLKKGYPERLLFLDQISDPGNLAAIFRNAAWFGFDGLILSSDAVDPFSPKVVRGSAGAIFRLPFWMVESAALVKNILGDFRWLAAEATGNTPVTKADKNPPYIICFGSEAHGLSTDVRSLCRDSLRIPSIAPQIESLNLATATAVIMYELIREEGL